MSNDRTPPRLLDLTRLVRRAGRVATGVDRVELAYLRRFAGLETQFFALVRSSYGFVLLDRDGMAALLDRVEGRTAWGRPDGLSRLARRLDPARRRAEADLRRLARARCLPVGLARMMRRHFPGGVQYVNVGHSNLTHRVLAALRQLPGARIAVMIHDTIPLDDPQFQRPETPAAFAAMLRRVQETADVVLCNSAATEADVHRHMQGHGPVPPTLVAHLGVDMPTVSNQAALPPGIDPTRPWFCTVGTIEPRKNHALLLDIWDDLARELPDAKMPQLLICGARGWMNDTVFARLDAVRGSPHIHELPGLDDAALAGLVDRAAGMLFPSRVEGYGLPPIEAAALGTPVVCAPLPVYREILGDIPIYVSPKDRYPWRRTIIGLMADHEAGHSAGRHARPFQPPTWDMHFKTVFTVL
ncbi:glycosyltransferase family 1 protein [Sediminimonas sp.]|uniref:glycosyltransferase family 4 protein n=1 Tax=Sediminimonas sp. TaxID=2823379 RepID=UPI0025CD2E9B|nr:glycosyltransferase family 1 protein [Sediminimonas sp.]